jgi:hypothetical protein
LISQLYVNVENYLKWRREKIRLMHGHCEKIIAFDETYREYLYFYRRITYLLTCLLAYLLTPWSRVLLEKLTGSQLVTKFPAFYGTLRSITAFTSARHLCLA